MDAPTSDNMPLGRLADAGRCRQCGYLLRGLTEPRCPECGRPFDPEDPNTMDLPEHLRLGKPPKPPEPFAYVMIGYAVLIAILAYVWFRSKEFLFQCLVATTWVPVGISWYKRNHASPEQLRLQPEGYRHWRRVLKVALLLSILSFPRHYTCCHASTTWLGPIGISYSTSGGPCHNKPHNGGTRISESWYWAW